MTGGASPRRSAQPRWLAGFERLDRGYGLVLSAASVAGAVAACVIMLAMSADVLVRNITNRSLAGTFEIVEVAMVLAVFMGLAQAERSKTTVRVTLFTALMPARIAEAMRLFGLLVTLGIVAWFTLACIDRALTSYATGEYRRGIISFPMWPGRSMVALGFTLLAIELVFGVTRRLIAILRPDHAVVAATGGRE